ncbi:MAG: alpha/beta fold hydrolase [Burkholderiaceae bacterium]
MKHAVIDYPRLTAPAMLWHFYERMDHMHHTQGKWLDAVGWGPHELQSRAALELPELTLKAYDEAFIDGLPILLVPAPIKQSYIWDLAPEVSVVRACIAGNLRPYLIQWKPPKTDYGLTDYANRFLAECIETIRRECGNKPVVLAGHSLGGILSAIYAAMHPTRVSGLVLVSAPLHFSFARKDGALGPMIEEVEGRSLLEAMQGALPGSLLSQVSFVASPSAFGKERWEDWLQSLFNPQALKTHMQVERWSLDELPLAERFVKDVVLQLYEEDAFMAGTLRIDTQRISPQDVVAPLLVVADRACPIVPVSAILPFFNAVGSTEKRLLWYEGDIGVAVRHVGALVGKSAHAVLWPEIINWVHKGSTA